MPPTRFHFCVLLVCALLACHSAMVYAAEDSDSYADSSSFSSDAGECATLWAAGQECAPKPEVNGVVVARELVPVVVGFVFSMLSTVGVYMYHRRYNITYA
jgi:hypothetical protein